MLFHTVPFFSGKRCAWAPPGTDCIFQFSRNFLLMLLSVFMFCHEEFTKASKIQWRLRQMIYCLFQFRRHSENRFFGGFASFDGKFPKTRCKVACSWGLWCQMQSIAMRFEQEIQRLLWAWRRVWKGKFGKFVARLRRLRCWIDSVHFWKTSER